MAVSNMGKGIPQPTINMVIDKDSSIKKVNLTHNEIGSRPSIVPSNIKNDMTVVNVSNTK